jgi:hypothetical protein
VVTRFADLVDLAERNLAVAVVRRSHPSAHPDPAVAPYLADLAVSLAHLGDTVGVSGRAARDLHRVLGSARIGLELPLPAGDVPVGIAHDIADAAIAIRTAADLVASNGPLPDDLTERFVEHSDWTHPRPEALYSLSARAGAWGYIADLALVASELATHAGQADLASHAEQWAHAALRVPRAAADPALAYATPGWPLPLPRHAVPNEWAGRLEELNATAWRLSFNAQAGQVPPQAALRHIAEIGYHLHRRASGEPGIDPREVSALHQRAQVWSRIHACVHAIKTPTEMLSPAQRFSLFRTLQLAHSGTLDGPDLLAGQTALAQAAAQAPAAIEALASNPAAGIGPDLPAELRQAHRGVLLASLNRQTVQIPGSALEPLAELYRTAASSVLAPTPRGDVPTSRPRLVATPGALRPSVAANAPPRRTGPGAHL